MHIYPGASPSPRLGSRDLVTMDETFCLKEEGATKGHPNYFEFGKCTITEANAASEPTV